MYFFRVKRNIISFKGDLENEFDIKSLNEEYLNSLVLGFNIDLNKEIEKVNFFIKPKS